MALRQGGGGEVRILKIQKLTACIRIPVSHNCTRPTMGYPDHEAWYEVGSDLVGILMSPPPSNID